MSREPRTPAEYKAAYEELKAEVARLTRDKNDVVRECHALAGEADALRGELVKRKDPT